MGKKPKTYSHEYIEEMRLQLQAMHLLYGMARGKSYSEVNLTLKTLSAKEKFKLKNEVIKHFKIFLEYFFFDPQNPLAETYSSGKLQRLVETKITPADIEEWMTNKSLRLFELPTTKEKPLNK